MSKWGERYSADEIRKNHPDSAWLADSSVGPWSLTCPSCAAKPGVLCSDSRQVYKKMCAYRHVAWERVVEQKIKEAVIA